MKNYVKEFKGYKVPEGATHFNDGGQLKPAFYKNVSGEWFCMLAVNDNHWGQVGMPPYTVIELPEAKQEWDGEGLPPVGTECEIRYRGDSDFLKCIINYISESIVVCTDESGAERAYAIKGIARFRPVTTQEQKDREAFIDDCLKATAGNEPHKIFHDLYEAGTRFTNTNQGDK